MMKKLFVLGIVLAMVMGLAAMAGAYEVGVTVSVGSAVSSVLMGDYIDPADGNVGFQAPLGASLGLGVAEIGGGSTIYSDAYDLNHAASTPWDIYVWGSGGLATTSTSIGIFLTDDGLQFPAPDGTVTPIASTTWKVVDLTTSQTVGTAKFTTIASASDGIHYSGVVTLGALSIAGTTQATAEHLQLETVVASTPEPGSMVALFSGLVGLVGYGIRRRK